MIDPSLTIIINLYFPDNAGVQEMPPVSAFAVETKSLKAIEIMNNELIDKPMDGPDKPLDFVETSRLEIPLSEISDNYFAGMSSVTRIVYIVKVIK